MKLVLLLFVAIALPEFTQVETPASKYQIVFGSFRHGDFASAVYSISVDGEKLKLLSRHKSGKPNCLDPKVSSDFKKIIFARGESGHRTSIWYMDADGTNEQQLTKVINKRFRNSAHASFSPDRSQFVYGSNLTHESDLFVANTKNGDVINLTGGKSRNKSAEWHPIKNKIAFTSDREGMFRVYTLNLDQKTPRLITPKNMEANFPSWSPNGDLILFSGSTDGKQYDLYTIKPDGTGLTQITHTDSMTEREGVFSPDAEYIAFEATPSDAPRGFEHSIYVIEAKTGKVKKLTESKFHDFTPSWILVGRE